MHARTHIHTYTHIHTRVLADTPTLARTHSHTFTEYAAFCQAANSSCTGRDAMGNVRISAVIAWERYPTLLFFTCQSRDLLRARPEAHESHIRLFQTKRPGFKLTILWLRFDFNLTTQYKRPGFELTTLWKRPVVNLTTKSMKTAWF